MSTLAVDYFDGRSSRPQRAALSVQDGRLRVERADAAPLEVPLREVRWPERTRHGARIAQLPDGAAVQALDVAGWDAWVAANAAPDSLVVKAQQSWRGTLVACAALVVLVVAGYLWGLPVAARAIVAFIPATVDALAGDQALQTIDGRWLKPSKLPAADQERLRAAFAEGVRKTYGAKAPPWRLEFRSGKIGPNAFALPGGTMIVTDELVAMVASDDTVLGVLGHEMGHVAHRHGMRQLVQVSALGAVLSVAFGDYGTFITTVPLVIASMGYSRDAEREADEESVRFMRAAGISPLAMVGFFEGVKKYRKDKGMPDGPGIAFSSHPADDARIEYFRRAAGR